MWLRVGIAGIALALGGGAVGAKPIVDGLTVHTGASVTVEVLPQVVRDELPESLFGFNIHHHGFERNLWDPGNNRGKPEVVGALRALPGAVYRYPGGLVANRFAWEQAVGDQTVRRPQKAVKWEAPAPVRFGVDEYLTLVRSVGGRPWYVLNLVGWSRDGLFEELPVEQVAASNARLAAHIKRHNDTGAPIYYELGNELDRADYEWPHAKYIERSRATIDAIRQVDPSARFVAFLREFDWQYRADPTRGTSRSTQFIRDVLTALPEVEDFSLHFYYDAPDVDRKSVQIPWRLARFRNAVETARAVRGGRPVGLWITEHARGIDPKRKAMDQREATSNLAATLSTGDFLIAATQMPEVKGACWHGLGARPWQLFDDSGSGLRERPVYWGMRVLKSLDLPVVLATRTRSPNHSGYAGGYDVRAAGFTDPERKRLGVWIVNRASTPMDVELAYAPFGGRDVAIQHRFIAGQPAVDPDSRGRSPRVRIEPDTTRGRFSPTGKLSLRVPPASLSAFEIAPAPLRAVEATP